MLDVLVLVECFRCRLASALIMLMNSCKFMFLNGLQVAWHLMLLPQHAEELLYDPDRCSCDLEWHCVPHDACFIHDSCFCKGSGSFPPVKPPRPSWAQFSYDWYCEFAPRLALHPHSPLPHFGSEVEPHMMFFGLSNPPS